MTRKCKDWLSSYLEFTQNLEAPDVFHYWVGVSTIAGALRRKVWINQVHFEWTPNFYIMLIAPPGIISKSTTAEVGMRLLREVDDNIKFGPDVITWQSLVQDLAAAKIMYQMSDTEFMPMSCLTFSSGELGNLLNPHDREMVDVLTRLYDGERGTFDKSTKTSGSDSIENPWINLIACTTPAWIQGHFPKHMMETGFSSRTIYVRADQKRRLIAYVEDEIDDMDALFELRDALIHDLNIIAKIRGKFTLEPEAKKWGKEWYDKHYHDVQEGKINIPGGYVARKQTHLHKLAMVLSASYRDDRIITLDDMIQSEKVLNMVEPEMLRVYNLVTDDDEVKRVGVIVEAVMHAKGKAQVGILYRLVRRHMGYEDFRKALVSAVEGGQVTVDQNTKTVRIREESDESSESMLH